MEREGRGGSKRRNVLTGTPWEDIVGFSRAVRVDRFVFVSGTVSADNAGKLVGGSDPYLQTRYALKKIETALKDIGASLDNVVRTRIFVCDIRQWREIARAHREVFGSIRPATSMIQVKRLIEPGYLVEIEADALVPES